MSMESFDESEMTFGPFDDGHCFRIELSDAYRAIQNHVQIAEFLLLRKKPECPPAIWIVEAKKSSPAPDTQPRFSEFIGEIRDKLSNALTVGVASILGRHPSAAAELPEPFKSLDLATAGFRLVLVVNGHEKSWLPPLQEALQRALHVTVKSWAIRPPAVVVLNHEGAKQRGLISAP